MGPNEILLSGGQFVDDKTCSLDTFEIRLDQPEFRELRSYMKVARMHHSMIYIEERGCVLAVGGEDENQGLLDSCESFNVQDQAWKMLNTMNQKSKNVGLCKFVRDGRRGEERPIYVYAFGKLAVERVEISSSSPKWEELIVKGF